MEPFAFGCASGCVVRKVTVAPFASNGDPDAPDTYGAKAVLQPAFASLCSAAAKGALITMKKTAMKRWVRIPSDLSEWMVLQKRSHENQNALASVSVNNLNSAVKWYEKVLRKPPDSRPMPEVAEWTFERGGWLQVYNLPERAGSGSFTLAVSSIDDQVVRLNKLGINTGQRSAGDKVKTLMITDPDGNHIAFAEAIDPGRAR
jgi:predicted enzyme related to lactoylglutathione lyase